MAVCLPWLLMVVGDVIDILWIISCRSKVVSMAHTALDGSDSFGSDLGQRRYVLGLPQLRESTVSVV